MLSSLEAAYVGRKKKVRSCRRSLHRRLCGANRSQGRISSRSKPLFGVWDAFLEKVLRPSQRYEVGSDKRRGIVKDQTTKALKESERTVGNGRKRAGPFGGQL